MGFFFVGNSIQAINSQNCTDALSIYLFILLYLLMIKEHKSIIKSFLIIINLVIVLNILNNDCCMLNVLQQFFKVTIFTKFAYILFVKTE